MRIDDPKLIAELAALAIDLRSGTSLAELTSLGVEPVLLGTSDPHEIDRAFVEWAEARRQTRWRRAR